MGSRSGAASARDFRRLNVVHIIDYVLASEARTREAVTPPVASRKTVATVTARRKDREASSEEPNEDLAPTVAVDPAAIRRLLVKLHHADPEAYAALAESLDIEDPKRRRTDRSDNRITDCQVGSGGHLQQRSTTRRESRTAKRFAVKERANPAFAAALVEQLLPVVAARPSFKLLSVTLTTPAGFGPVANAARRFGERLAEEQQEQGVFLTVDRRSDGSEHLHGLALVARLSSAREEWIDNTGASAEACRLVPVTAWDEFVETGHTGSLRNDLRRIISYQFKPLPTRKPRAIAEETAATGPFAAPWSAFLALNMAPEPSPALQRFDEMGRAVTCAYCGAPLPATGRRDRRTCKGSRCRTALHRRNRALSPT